MGEDKALGPEPLKAFFHRHTIGLIGQYVLLSFGGVAGAAQMECRAFVKQVRGFSMVTIGVGGRDPVD